MLPGRTNLALTSVLIYLVLVLRLATCDDFKNTNRIDDGFSHSFPPQLAESAFTPLVKLGNHENILAISEFEGFLAVAMHTKILIYQLQSDGKTGEVKAILKQEIVLTNPLRPEGELKEFRWLNGQTVIACDSISCRTCHSKANQWSCLSYSIQATTHRPRAIASLRAVATGEDALVQLRFVDEQSRAHILNITVSAGQVATDKDYQEPQQLAAAFTRHGFVYYVGSTTRPFEPTLFAKLQEEDERSAIRLTRVCARDRTPKLLSRMDMALTCHSGIEAGNDGYANRVTTAAVYDKALDRLLVAMQSPAMASANNASPDLICQFDMNELEKKFDGIWSMCQDTPYINTQTRCQYVTSVDRLPEQCFIFTHMASSSNPCSTFNWHDKQENTLGNCELHRTNSTANLYGWLEDFRPVFGTLLARLRPGSGQIIDFVSTDDNSAFVKYKDGSVLRIPLNALTPDITMTTPLWHSKVSKTANGAIAFDAAHHSLFVLDKDNSSQVKQLPLNCARLYPTCDAVMMTRKVEPLQCVWCVTYDGVGRSVAAAECNGEPFTDLCPPRIDSMNPFQSGSDLAVTTIEIRGDHLNSLVDMKLNVCNKICETTDIRPKVIICVVPLALGNIREDCTEMSGKLGPFHHTAKLRNLVSSGTQTEEENIGLTIDPTVKPSSSGISKGAKAVISVVSVLILLAVIGFIIYCMWKHRDMLRQGRHRVPKPKRTNSSIPIAEFHTGKEFPNIYGGTSPYEQLVDELDPRLSISKEDICFDTEIGRGHFGVVNKATYTNLDKGIQKKVACKMLQPGAVGVREFLKEGLMMTKFDHPRVMRLIGIAFTENHYPIIITDFMPNADLLKYLRDPEKTPTLRTLLNFAVQIAEGMDYLHRMKFIHRDLAARNCMLDNVLNIKIADFGLCRELSKYEDYEPIHKNRDLPLRWMPLEALEREQYTPKGDVWSYGVVLWELMTRGLQPYAHQLIAVVLDLLQSGRRLEQPAYCPTQLYEEVMMPCWSRDPEDRPGFDRLGDMVINVITTMERDQAETAALNRHYEQVSQFRQQLRQQQERTKAVSQVTPV